MNTDCHPNAVGERAADDRPEPGAEPGRDAPDADRAGTLERLGEEVDDDREARRRQRGAAERLQDAERDQPAAARRERAQERAAREQHVARAEHALAPEAIGQEARAQEQARADEVVGVDDPRRLVRADVQVGLQRGQRDDDHGDVERHEEDPERQREQRHGAVLAHRCAP